MATLALRSPPAILSAAATSRATGVEICEAATMPTQTAPTSTRSAVEM